jgi:hypothetical protein
MTARLVVAVATLFSLVTTGVTALVIGFWTDHNEDHPRR